MSVVGVALYGSRAREDHDEDSDVDLLAVTTGGPPAAAVQGRITVASYPVDQLVRIARGGDLFALHIVSEAKVIYETRPVFDSIRRAFAYRPDYSREIRLASDAGWFLARYHDRFHDAAVFNWKVAWCTRIILTARAANERRPLFSAAGLAAYSGSSDVLPLLKNKASREIDAGMVERFRNVLVSLGAAEPPHPPTLDEQRRLFELDRNEPGLSAIRALMK